MDAPRYGWQRSFDMTLRGHKLSDIFTRHSHDPVFFEQDEDEHNSTVPVFFATDVNDVLYRLGFDDLPQGVTHHAAYKKSNTYDVAFALSYFDLCLGKHLAFEMGSDLYHVRLDFKSTSNGSVYKLQLDQMMVWDNTRYGCQVPFTDERFFPFVEEIFGSIEPSVQALENGDDRESFIAFNEIGLAMGMWKPSFAKRYYDDASFRRSSKNICAMNDI